MVLKYTWIWIVWYTVFAIAGATNDGSQVTTADNGSILEQNSQFSADLSLHAEDCNKMDRRVDQRYSYAGSTPGVRYVTPVGNSPQTPFDASRHHSALNSHNFRYRDSGQFRPPNHVFKPSHIFNPVPGPHSVPEATPFQAIVNPLLENGYSGPQNIPAAVPRPCSWRMSPSGGHHGGIAGEMGTTPWFRRTPGARRPNVGSSPRASFSCESMNAPLPLFQPSCVRTGMACGPHASGTTFPFRENDPQSVSTGSSYPASAFSASGNVADGVELVVSNLDYNISSHEWKKILACELQQQVQVCLQNPANFKK